MIPEFPDLFSPILDIFADCEEHENSNINSQIADMYNVTDEERKSVIFKKRVRWVLTYFYKAKILDRIKRGLYQITERGLDLFNEGLETINTTTLRRYPEFDAFRKSGKFSDSLDEETTDEEEDMPTIADIKSCDWSEFEKYITDVLHDIGFNEPFECTSTEDEDIRIETTKDQRKYIIAAVQYQTMVIDDTRVKNFTNEINDNGADCGIYITTTVFSREAIEWCQENIRLIDGNELCNLIPKRITHNKPLKELPKHINSVDDLITQIKNKLAPVLKEYNKDINLTISYKPDNDITISYDQANDSNETKQFKTTEDAPLETEVKPDPNASTNNAGGNEEEGGPLKVVFSNGMTFNKLYANATLVEVINYVGPSRVYNLDLFVTDTELKPLIYTSFFKSKICKLKELNNGYYVDTCSTTLQKAQTILNISNRLNLDIEVWVNDKEVTLDDFKDDIKAKEPTTESSENNSFKKEYTGDSGNIALNPNKGSNESEATQQVSFGKLVNQYASYFEHLHTAPGAPHKPIMLLVVLDMIANNEITDNKIYYNDYLVEKFTKKWNQYIKVQTKHKCTPYNPFFYLDSEPFWVFKSTTQIITPVHHGLIRNKAYAIIDKGLLNVCTSSYAMIRLRKILESQIKP